MTKSFAKMFLVAVALFISATAQASVGFDFAADTQGWVAETGWGYGTPTLSRTDFHGGSLQANTSTMTYGTGTDENWAKVYLKGDLGGAQNLTSTPIYSLEVYVPGNMWVQAKLGIRTDDGDSWELYESPETAELSTSTWQTITWDMSGVPDLNNAREIGVELFGWFPVPKEATFNIDNASANTAPIPEPASLLLLGTGLIGIFGLKNRKARG